MVLRAVSALVLAFGASAHAADLTPTETRWLRGAAPVLASDLAQALPVDIVVQPQPTPGYAPLALAFVGGRCKLVLSMRGNAEAEAALARTEPALLDAALELMTAHELAHCQRHVSGAWLGRVPPAGDLAAQREAMQASRREEGFADLAGLAWIAARRPAQYAQLHRWLLAERQRERVPGGSHDTLDWVQAAAAGVPGAAAAPFAAAAALWAAVPER